MFGKSQFTTPPETNASLTGICQKQALQVSRKPLLSSHLGQRLRRKASKWTETLYLPCECQVQLGDNIQPEIWMSSCNITQSHFSTSKDVHILESVYRELTRDKDISRSFSWVLHMRFLPRLCSRSYVLLRHATSISAIPLALGATMEDSILLP